VGIWVTTGKKSGGSDWAFREADGRIKNLFSGRNFYSNGYVEGENAVFWVGGFTVVQTSFLAMKFCIDLETQP